MSKPRKIRKQETRLTDTDPQGNRAQRRAAKRADRGVIITDSPTPPFPATYQTRP